MIMIKETKRRIFVYPGAAGRPRRNITTAPPLLFHRSRSGFSISRAHGRLNYSCYHVFVAVSRPGSERTSGAAGSDLQLRRFVTLPTLALADGRGAGLLKLPRDWIAVFDAVLRVARRLC